MTKKNNKLAWMIGAGLIALMAVLYASSQMILLKGFADLENRRMLRDVARVKDALDASIADMDRQATDWSSWDDSYAFVRTGDPEYITKNLPDETFTRLRLNIMLFVRPDGQMMYAEAFDLGEGKKAPLSPGVAQHLAQHPDLLRHEDIRQGHAGIIMLPEGPMQIAARPILTSEGNGPVAGTLIMGRYLDAAEIGRYARMTHVDLAVQQSGTRSQASGGSESWAKVVDDQTITGFTALRDVYGEPALIFKVSAPRDMYQYGRNTINYFLLWLLSIAGVSAVIVYLVLKKLARSQAEHREIQARYSAVVEQSAEGMLLIDHESKRVVDANPAMCKLLGYDKDEFEGLPVSEVLGCEPAEADAYVGHITSKRQYVREETSYQRKDKSFVDVEVGAKIIVHDGKEVLCIVAQDITERRRAQEQIEYLAHFDALTGLPNRALLGDRLRQTIAHSNRSGTMAAVFLLNVDRFKIVNDTLGQHVGDLLLQAIAQRLRDTVRVGDTVARHGGDEFVVVLGGVRLVQDCLTLGDKILEALARPIEVKNHELHMTPSIGISLYPGDGENVETLLKNADIAMDKAKGEGGNTYRMYASNMNVHTFERLTIENSLRHALEREEFSLHYQPQVDLATGRVYGMEALLRWKHPKLGQVSPVKFIPVAEETGLIISIGEWVLRTACRQARKWQERGFPPLVVAVNLSVRQFAQKNLVQLIEEVLAETGLPACCLDIELTESMLMSNIEDNVKVLREIKGRGVSISVDDFGTGYSSLAYLQQMPIDTMKIDRSFVRDISGPGSQAPIAKAVIVLAHSLGMGTIAEGVETQAQLEFMRAHGCKTLQGNYFSPPLSTQEFTELLERGRTLRDVEAAYALGAAHRKTN